MIQGFDILERGGRGVLKTTAPGVTSQRAAQAAALSKAKQFPPAGQNEMLGEQRMETKCEMSRYSQLPGMLEKGNPSLTPLCCPQGNADTSW